MNQFLKTFYLIVVMSTIFLFVSCSLVKPNVDQNTIDQLNQVITLVKKSNDSLKTQNRSLTTTVDTLQNNLVVKDSLIKFQSIALNHLQSLNDSIDSLIKIYSLRIDLLQFENDSLMVIRLKHDSTFYNLAKQLNNGIVNNIDSITIRLQKLKSKALIK